MVQTAGRPIAATMRLLLNERRLLALPKEQRLAGLLAESRKFQNEVSERLASQVLHALYELLRGFQAAHDTSKGELLAAPLADNPDDIYRALLTGQRPYYRCRTTVCGLRKYGAIRRFTSASCPLLGVDSISESGEHRPASLSQSLQKYGCPYRRCERAFPSETALARHVTYLSAYSLAGLHQRLREDAAFHPDTMDQRHGAYAQLLALFRMIHDGARSRATKLPPRHSVLFDPDRYRFLEGRDHQIGGARRASERIEAPWGLSDGTIYRVLESSSCWTASASPTAP